jgi:hypothetical protein
MLISRAMRTANTLRTTIPAHVRRQLLIAQGDHLLWEYLGDGAFKISNLTTRVNQNGNTNDPNTPNQPTTATRPANNQR